MEMYVEVLLVKILGNELLLLQIFHIHSYR